MFSSSLGLSSLQNVFIYACHSCHVSHVCIIQYTLVGVAVTLAQWIEESYFHNTRAKIVNNAGDLVGVSTNSEVNSFSI